MRKISVFLIICVMLCFSSCNNDERRVDLTCDNLNRLSQVKYDKVTVEVSTVTEGILLKAIYEVDSDSVNYSIEQLNTVSPGGVIPETFKQVIEGSADVENGELREENNDKDVLPEESVLMGRFYFSADNLKNVACDSDSLVADIISPSNFLGNEFSIDNMSVSVLYNEKAIEEIVINYEAEKSMVNMHYVFFSVD